MVTVAANQPRVRRRSMSVFVCVFEFFEDTKKKKMKVDRLAVPSIFAFERDKRCVLGVVVAIWIFFSSSCMCVISGQRGRTVSNCCGNPAPRHRREETLAKDKEQPRDR